MQNDNDTNDKGRAKTSLTKYVTSHIIVRVQKGLLKVSCERELETEQNCNILTPTLMAFSVMSFSFSRAAQPEAHRPTLLGAGFLYRILSPTGLQTPSGSRGPFRPGVAFPTTSYQQLLWTPTQSGALRAPSAGSGFPYHFSSLLHLSDFLS